MEDIILKIKNILLNMTSAQVALLSVIVTLFLFFLGKRKENQLRLYETREKHYIHLLELFKKIFASADNVKKCH